MAAGRRDDWTLPQAARSSMSHFQMSWLVDAASGIVIVRMVRWAWARTPQVAGYLKNPFGSDAGSPR